MWELSVIPGILSHMHVEFAKTGRRKKQGEEETLYRSWKYKFLKITRIIPLNYIIGQSVSSVIQSCPTLWDSMDCSTPGFPFHHPFPELTQTHVHWVRDAIQPFHPPLSPSPPAFNLSQHQGLFQWVSSLPQVAKVLGLQLQHQSFQWIFRVDFL